MSDVNVIWDGVLDVVRGELTTPVFKTWFEHARALFIDPAGVFVIGVQNEFAREWFESRYSSLIRSALSQVTGENLSMRVVIDREGPDETAGGGPADADAPAEEESPALTLDDTEQQRLKDAAAGDFGTRYTFDTFVIGQSNRFACTAALAVAEAPGLSYNPLFIYGGAGLGKTHLLQAVGHYVRRNYPNKKVVYVSTEQFTNDFINSIRDRASNRIDGFRQRYRSSDVLLVDDVQFLKGKEGIQEEFFHTFNALQQSGKAVVLSSDRPPKDIPTLEDRLRSRFSMGLITDIQPPDLETRIAILRRKVEAEHLVVPDDVLEFTAGLVSSNVRELEGALTRIAAYGSLSRHTVDLELAKTVLQDAFPERSTRPIPVSTIQREVCKYYSLSHAQLVGSKRTQAIVYPRQIAMYLARELTDLSLPKIGEEFGGRDHTTVMHATAKIHKLMNAQREVYNQIQSLTNSIRQHA
jgi:chromosomal replication initiator protein